MFGSDCLGAVYRYIANIQSVFQIHLAHQIWRDMGYIGYVQDLLYLAGVIAVLNTITSRDSIFSMRTAASTADADSWPPAPKL